MSSDVAPDVSALAINVTIPEGLRWTDTRRGEGLTLTTLNVGLLPDGRLAAKAYGRPTGGGRGTYVSFPVPSTPELAALVAKAASRASALGRPPRYQLRFDCCDAVGTPTHQPCRRIRCRRRDLNHAECARSAADADIHPKGGDV